MDKKIKRSIAIEKIIIDKLIGDRKSSIEKTIGTFKDQHTKNRFKLTN